jgi:hypothetical protein
MFRTAKLQLLLARDYAGAEIRDWALHGSMEPVFVSSWSSLFSSGFVCKCQSDCSNLSKAHCKRRIIHRDKRGIWRRMPESCVTKVQPKLS